MMNNNTDNGDDAVHASNYNTMVKCKVWAIAPSKIITYIYISWIHLCILGCFVVIFIMSLLYLYISLFSCCRPSRCLLWIVNRNLQRVILAVVLPLLLCKGCGRLKFIVFVLVYPFSSGCLQLILDYFFQLQCSALAVMEPMESHVPSWYHWKEW